MTAAPPTPFSPRRVVRLMGRGTGIGLLLAAPAAGLLCWLILTLVADIVADPPYPAGEIPAFARRAVAWRAATPLLAAPAFACGLLLVIRPGGRPLLLATVGTVVLLVPFGLALVCFVMLIAPMYQYRAL